MGKVKRPHRCRLTTASTSQKVAVCLQYQADTRDRNVPIRVQRLPKECHKTVEAKEERSRAPGGSIRPLALSSRYPNGRDPPQKSLPDSSASSASLTIRSAVWLGSVEKMALGGTLARWITSQDESR